MVVLFKTMIKGVGSNQKGQDDHPNFKRYIVDDIDPE